MEKKEYERGFLPYGAAALMVGLVGGFSAVLGPAFVKDIGIAYNNTTWTALATAMSTAAFAPIMGKLADAVGRRGLLIFGVSIYTLGNALTALATNLPLMLMARFILGVGTAAVAPVVMSYILSEYPKEKIGKGFSVYMLISSASVVVGPTVGSWIISTWGWRSMVWICTGLCLVVLMYVMSVREQNIARKDALVGFDTPGAVLVVIFFGLALCIPSFGQNFGWDSWTFRIIFLAAAVSLIGMTAAEKKAKNPILPLTVLKQRQFVLSVLALFLTQGLMQANMTNTIIFVEYTQPGNTVVSGFAISVMYIGMALGAVVLGPQADRFEPKQVLTCSLTLTAAGCATMLLFTENASVFLLMLSLGLLGFGLGGNGTIFMKVVLAGIPQQMAGAGTGTYGLFRDLAAPFGVAVLVPLFTNGITAGIGNGMEETLAAVSSIRSLAVVETISVMAGIGIVQLLPGIRHKKSES